MDAAKPAAREFISPAHTDWTDAEFAGMAMAQALRGFEDDPVAYTLADLLERWQ